MPEISITEAILLCTAGVLCGMYFPWFVEEVVREIAFRLQDMIERFKGK